MKRFILPLLTVLTISACGPSNGSGPVDVAIIGDPESLFQQGVRLSPAAQHLRAASFEGLVALDPAGQIVPAIAERWIVTDDGRSYIFRLRNSTWPDGEPITAQDIRSLLRDTIARLEGTSLGLDLAKVTEVRAMTGRVVELRLSSPMPEFLRLLAQPELGFVKNGSGAGPMVASRDEEAPVARLSALPPEARGLPAREDWEETARVISVRALPAENAVEAFADGEVDLLLNGRLSSFPLAQLGPLSRGAIQVDPAQGLLGLAIRNDSGVLATAARREALSMALDREALIQPFGLGGWQPTTWIIPPGQFSTPAYPASRWANLSLDERRAIAARRIAEYRSASGEDVVLRVGLPEGPGSDILFEQFEQAWNRIGIQLVKVRPGAGADLELRDRLARYSSPRWYLNQFNCELEIGLCAPEADALVRQSLSITDPVAKERILAEAHAAMVEEEVFIPLGAPVRWSLVRGAVNGYVANQWGLHPLFPLSQPTT
ncbi:ABC transporter substrate-binding protein [Erythrobacter sp. THAF29]|uniref:ABC transporter substrate-binding protein n=1 Tax=Erythrobacter sp. THAF29 TaxID=2587851 RepID=UPI0012A7E963|nr:ABC transporter substrate-binding protein [Erythrobacter sp. THAF29]QFT76124.1 Periplasmic oligopeptide-binding protein precursor [Erythrobacter sp. THAF29]